MSFCKFEYCWIASGALIFIRHQCRVTHNCLTTMYCYFLFAWWYYQNKKNNKIISIYECFFNKVLYGFGLYQTDLIHGHTLDPKVQGRWGELAHQMVCVSLLVTLVRNFSKGTAWQQQKCGQWHHIVERHTVFWWPMQARPPPSASTVTSILSNSYSPQTS